MRYLVHTVRAINWEEIVRVFAALPTPVIAGIALYIAWEQKQINRGQFRVALLDRRFKVFEATAELVAKIQSHARLGQEDLHIFLYETRGNEFLFGDDIKAYLNEVYERASTVHALEGAPQDLEDLRAALLWFFGQGEEMKRRFAKYMTFRDDF